MSDSSRTRSRFGICFQTFISVVIHPYYWTAYRIRTFGRLPWRRGGTLVLCNHEHDFDSTVSITNLQWLGPWNKPIYSAAGRRMFETGFMAARLPLGFKYLRRVNATKLFSAMGMLPIENQLRSRSLASLAFGVYERYGEVPLDKVFNAGIMAQLDPQAASTTVGHLFAERWFKQAQDTLVPIKAMLEPYRSEVLALTRQHLEPDYQRFQRLLREGDTVFLTPEGFYSRDGRVGRLLSALMRLAPAAESIYLNSIAYDVFVGKRLSMIIRIVEPADRNDLETSIRAARPVTVSQLLGAWLFERDGAPFARREAIDGVCQRLASLPAGAFVDPELRGHPTRMAMAALVGLMRRGTLVERGGELQLTSQRRHEQFPLVDDMVGFQSRFFGETVAALERLAGRRS